MARLDQETILDAIRHLPAEEQLEIARTILSWADTTVEQWLDEHRAEQYGR